MLYWVVDCISGEMAVYNYTLTIYNANVNVIMIGAQSHSSEICSQVGAVISKPSTLTRCDKQGGMHVVTPQGQGQGSQSSCATIGIFVLLLRLAT